jgi:hypothetical protein
MVVVFDCWVSGAITLHPVAKMHHADGRINAVFQFAPLHMPNYCMQAERRLTRSVLFQTARPSADAEAVRPLYLLIEAALRNSFLVPKVKLFLCGNVSRWFVR